MVPAHRLLVPLVRPLLLPLLVLALAPSPARAQDADPTCHPVSPTERVVVSLRGGLQRRGSLLCLSDTEALLAGRGGLERHALSEVRRIVTRPDPVWDGAAKGAAVPLIIWALWCRHCDAAPMLRTVATYSLIGLSFDVLHSTRRTLYDGRPAASLSYRLRF